MEEGGIFLADSLIELGYLSSSPALGLGFTPLAPLVLRLGLITPLAFLSLQLAHSRSWDFSASTID